MANMPNRHKVVVTRRDFGFGGKPVKFVFRPTCLRPVFQVEGLDDVLPGNNSIRYKRVASPWLPFFEVNNVGDSVSTTANITHFGMCACVRPLSFTAGNFPYFATKTYLDVEFRKSQRLLIGTKAYPDFPYQTGGYDI